MADPVDISQMPDPTTIGLSPTAQADPSAGMPTPAQLYKQHHGYDAPSPEDVTDFMRNPDATPPVKGQKTARQGLSMLSGLPSIVAQANPITPIVAGAVGGLNALPASVGAIMQGTIGNNPDDAARLGALASEKLRSGAGAVYNLANYIPSKIITKEGQAYANAVLGLPQAVAKSAEPALNATIGEPATTTLGEYAGDAAALLPGLGIKGVARGAVRLGKAGAGAVADALRPGAAPEGTAYDQAGTAVAPAQALVPPVSQPITGDTLRAQPNPIPAPEGSIHRTLTEEGKSPAAPPGPAAAAPAEAPTAPQAPPESPATQGTAEAPPAPEPAPASPSTPALPDTDNVPVDMSMPADSQRGSVRLFNSPADEGPQETPHPEQQTERAQHLNDLDQLSGGMLPSRRASAVSGDYNATGDDYQLKEVGSEPMRQQIASENDALHQATENVHDSVGSQFPNSVDTTTLGDRGRVTRGAIQSIQGWFDKATDETYDAARDENGGRPIAKLQRVSDYLNDDSNFANDAEIGLQRAAKQRLQRLWTTGDPDKGAPPGSVNAAEKFREFLNDKGRNPSAMGVASDLKNHLDLDVAEHGGPGLFETARNMRRHSYQMLEEPTGIKKLLAPADSQGINHAIPEHKVMDYIADLPREQHEHVLNVLRAGAHLGGGELADTSAAAIREIQAHTVSRIHAAATNADGTWNARKAYNAADRYARNMPDTFRDRPDVVRNLKTINDAGNTLHMDKHYPGAAAQAERTGLGTTVLKGVGGVASSLAHEIPLAGRLIGRGIEGAVEGMSEKSREAARDKAATSRLVDRTGKQRGSVPVMNGDSPADRVKKEFDMNKPDAPAGYLGKRVGNSTAEIYKDPGDPNTVHIEKLTADQPGSGAGTTALKHITNLADKHGASLTLDAVPQGPNKVSPERLRAYYERHGFRPDGNTESSMTREPAVRVPAGQRGSFSFQNDNALNRATGAARSLQRGEGINPRNERGEYNANRQLGGGARSAEQNDILRRLSGQRGSVRVMNEAPNKEEGAGSMLNVGLHQGQEGQPGFKKMSKQQAQAAVESTGAKVTKNTVLMPKPNGPFEPTSVMSTDRPLSHEEMQHVLAKTKQSAIPQRTEAGETSMHVAPGHEETAAKEGWNEFSPDYFREHNGQSMSDATTNPKNIHPASTVRNPTRSAYPGIYDDPKDIASKVQTSPESKHLGDIFGTTRQQMHDEVVKQGDVAPKSPMPGIAPKAKGSMDAMRVTTPENAARLRDTISAFKDAHPEAYNGMVSWYHMDPMFRSIKDILGGDADKAGDVFHKLNTYTSLSSPMSSVEPEIRRGTAAATMAAEGKFNQFAEHGGNPTSKAALKKAPELQTAPLGIEGHAFHSTAHAPALTRFNEYGEEARAPKTGAYRRASDAASRPNSDYQNTVMVGDSHFSRGAGLADVRGGQHYDGSISGPELKTMAPWFHENVAKPLGIPATSAQAAQWAALSHETGVETAIGAPKLEIFANEIAKAAHKAGVEPKEMWERIVKRLAGK